MGKPGLLVKQPALSNKGRRLVNELTNIYRGFSLFADDYEIMTSCRDACDVGGAGLIPSPSQGQNQERGKLRGSRVCPG